MLQSIVFSTIKVENKFSIGLSEFIYLYYLFIYWIRQLGELNRDINLLLEVTHESMMEVGETILLMMNGTKNKKNKN